MNKGIELLIVGGGCAGLSLAWRLAQRPDAPRTLIVEPRRQYDDDRTWCGWPVTNHPFRADVTARWESLGVHSPRRSVRVACRRYPYEMLESGHFYQRTLDAIAQSAPVELRRGTRIAELKENDSGVVAHLDSGERLNARFAVDTRPRPRRLEAPWLWQDFAGINVESHHIAPHAELMDFRVGDGREGGIDFLYMLPYASHRALFEWTRFGRPPTDPGVLQRRLQSWLDERLGSSWQALRRETGTLPMAPAAPHHGHRIAVAGAFGGSMRAATGYAFHAIQRWAERCAEALLAGSAPLSDTQGPWLARLDRVFMSTLERYPERAPEFYCQLFERAPTESLIRFLSGVPTPGDTLAVMRALPWWPLTSTALKQWRHLF
ncbi:lycopene cyclase family protein [Kushneria aurantia]|uniref:Lycopene cyclase family protein n=1 Tax=Kushneria aurantia TaxID=504092 RepID=A0ABV6G4U1_9GAMM|nr:lycopene cyclase family protein [Kushneria aurantia]